MNMPKLPQAGRITSFSYLDGVGRIELDDHTELKVGSAALKSFVSFEQEERPLVGARVEVHEVAPHPLGGLRALRVTRVGKEVAFDRIGSAEEWESKLRAAGLTAEQAAKVRGAIRPAAHLVAKTARTRRGGSKIGGAPDLPKTFAWPAAKGRPLAFLAQVANADIPASVRDDLGLVKTGLLAFFIGRANASGDVSCAVSHFGGSERLKASATSEAPLFEETAIALTEIWTPPPLEMANILLADDPEALRVYEAALADHVRAHQGSPAHRVGGHPIALAHAVEQEPERLLLQLDSDHARDISWEDGGRLLFLVARPAALERIRCVLQTD